MLDQAHDDAPLVVTFSAPIGQGFLVWRMVAISVTACREQGTLVSSSDEELTRGAPDDSAAAAVLVRLAKRRIAGQAGGEGEEAGLTANGESWVSAGRQTYLRSTWQHRCSTAVVAEVMLPDKLANPHRKLSNRSIRSVE